MQNWTASVLNLGQTITRQLLCHPASSPTWEKTCNVNADSFNVATGTKHCDRYRGPSASVLLSFVIFDSVKTLMCTRTASRLVQLLCHTSSSAQAWETQSLNDCCGRDAPSFSVRCFLRSDVGDVGDCAVRSCKDAPLEHAKASSMLKSSRNSLNLCTRVQRWPTHRGVCARVYRHAL